MTLWHKVVVVSASIGTKEGEGCLRVSTVPEMQIILQEVVEEDIVLKIQLGQCVILDRDHTKAVMEGTYLPDTGLKERLTGIIF